MESDRTIDTKQPIRRAAIGIGIAMVLAAAGLLFVFNPSETAFYPRCYFKMFTGLDCPGCGGLRAAHQLLHGNIAAAFALNPLLVALLPVGAWFGLSLLLKRFTGHGLPNPFRSVNWVWGVGIAVIAFGILRNLPLRAWLGS